MIGIFSELKDNLEKILSIFPKNPDFSKIDYHNLYECKIGDTIYYECYGKLKPIKIIGKITYDNVEFIPILDWRDLNPQIEPYPEGNFYFTSDGYTYYNLYYNQEEYDKVKNIRQSIEFLQDTKKLNKELQTYIKKLKDYGTIRK
jgi:hypothetical protein